MPCLVGQDTLGLLQDGAKNSQQTPIATLSTPTTSRLGKVTPKYYWPECLGGGGNSVLFVVLVSVCYGEISCGWSLYCGTGVDCCSNLMQNSGVNYRCTIAANLIGGWYVYLDHSSSCCSFCAI